MADELYGGSTFDFAGSLAEEIEDAFREVRARERPRRRRPRTTTRGCSSSRSAAAWSSTCRNERGRLRHVASRARSPDDVHPTIATPDMSEHLDYPVRRRRPRGRRGHGRRRPRPRPDLPGAVHEPGRAREPPRRSAAGSSRSSSCRRATPLAAALQAMVKGALQKWLEREIEVEQVAVETIDERIEVTVAYRRRAGGERRVETFGAAT